MKLGTRAGLARCSVVLAFLAMLMITGSQSAAAQEEIGPLSCGFYETYDEAQSAFDEGLKDNTIQDLDLDGDAIVCEDTFDVGDGEQVQDFASCATFASQEDAQNFLEGTPTDEEIDALDANGDGIACEDEFEDVVVDPTSCGQFENQEDAQQAFDDGSVSNPENLDGDGDGIACEDAFDVDEVDDSEAPGDSDDTSSDDVSQLPSTGSGSANADTAFVSMLGGLMAIMLVVTGVTTARTSRTPRS